MRKFKITGIVTGCILALSCLAWSQQGEQSRQWWLNMRQLSTTLSELMPDLVSEERFNSPTHAADIQKNAKQLAAFAHKIQPKDHEFLPPDADPSIPIMAKLFEDQTSKASQELAAGHRSYARSLLKSSVNYCLACHTRTLAPDLPGVTLKFNTKGLSKYEKAELYVAGRDFDKAYKEYDAIAGDESLAAANALFWERAARSGLAVAVRVQQNPHHAASIVKRILEMSSAPMVTKSDAKVWMQSITDWEKERRPKEITADYLYKQANHLMQRARATQRFPTDHSADILYLRATVAIHQLLRMDPDGPNTQVALYWAGVAYDALHDLNLWSLHDQYYEACIHTTPHSLVAKKCYKEYEESMRENYSGTMGTEIPADVKKHLQDLRKIAY